MKAALHFGDNLEWLKRQPSASVDLCYIDPPFNSKADYNVIIGGAQLKAFSDTWGFGIDDMRVQMALAVLGEERVQNWTKGMLVMLGHCGMASYLLFMAERLLEIKRVLKPTGSIYLHCDDAADYHLRMVMDAVFGPEYWKNSIVWHYSAGGVSKTAFARKHDTIHLYAMDGATFNTSREEGRTPYNLTDDVGRKYYRKVDAKSKKEYRYYEDEGGRVAHDVWEIPSLRNGPERVYPTQKPVALLERIISASSNLGDVVMDCFLGSGTTAVAAVKLGRQFVGCDLAYAAVEIAEKRLLVLDPKAEVSVTGHPASLEDARSLAERDKWQFQAWALDMIGYNPTGDWTARKGADGGVDGIKVQPLADGSTYTTIASVKGGHKPKLSELRDLIGTVTAKGAQRGILLTLEPPSEDMVATAAAIGINGFGEARCVILSAQDLLDGKQPTVPGP